MSLCVGEEPAYSRGDGGWQVLTVAELSRCIRGVIEAEDLFADVCVRGEVSNLVEHSSGHVYFSLKDDKALLRSVIWKGNARNTIRITNGMRVIARGRVTVYEKNGQYQLVVEEVTADGVGALHVALEKLKAKLLAEGLFDESRKVRMPSYPCKIAIVTSPTAAALRDMVSIAQRRMPGIHLLLIPTLMQGASSESSIVSSIRLADEMNDVDVIVLGRGGGSIEDLWSFNAEIVVRAIAACKKPIVSAIGHETDYTLADLAADLRAPTPSAAMELIIPDREELLGRIRVLVDEISSSVQTGLTRKSVELERLVNSSSMKYPERMIQERWQSVDLLSSRLQGSYREMIGDSERRLGEVSARLESLSPLGVLARGYGIVRDDSGTVVRRTSDAKIGDEIVTLLSDGRLKSRISEIKEGWE